MKNTKIILLAILLFISGNVLAKPFWVPTFKKGDAISAEVFNKAFQKIQRSETPPTSNDLNGDWECSAVSGLDAVNAIGNTVTDDWETTDSGNCFYTSGILNFSDGMISSDVFLFHPQIVGFAHYGSLDTDYDIVDDTIYFRVHSDFRGGNAVASYKVQMSGNDHITLSPGVSMVGPDASYFGNPATLNCDRSVVAPLPPEALTAEVEAGVVTLTWEDESDDETGFKVYRRADADDSFAEAGETTGTDYSDTPGVGKFFYKVVSENANGESDVGSIVKIEVE